LLKKLRLPKRLHLLKRHLLLKTKKPIALIASLPRI
jgi:hypothetical protein